MPINGRLFRATWTRLVAATRDTSRSREQPDGYARRPAEQTAVSTATRIDHGGSGDALAIEIWPAAADLGPDHRPPQRAYSGARAGS